LDKNRCHCQLVIGPRISRECKTPIHHSIHATHTVGTAIPKSWMAVGSCQSIFQVFLGTHRREAEVFDSCSVESFDLTTEPIEGRRCAAPYESSRFGPGPATDMMKTRRCVLKSRANFFSISDKNPAGSVGIDFIPLARMRAEAHDTARERPQWFSATTATTHNKNPARWTIA